MTTNRRRAATIRRARFALGALAVALAEGAAPAETVPVVAPAEGAARVAAAELSRALASGWTNGTFPVAASAPAGGRSIRLAVDPALAPEAWAVRPDGRGVAIAAGSPLGLSHAVHSTLERIGFGSYLTTDAAPAPRPGAPDFAAWAATDAPLARERIVFNWHNFLSGCSSWNFDDWALWIDQSRKMRFNTVMIHAYGNNPMFTFTHNGVAKPAGFLTSTVRGRDWGTEHVNDVRRLAGGSVFAGPVFGADAALAPVDRRAEETQALMKRVIAHAGTCGMHVCFALDVDTASSNPQEVILTLPESARFRLADGATWLARPDTPEGYAYYRSQAKALLDLYPQIDRLAIWVRTGGTTWTALKEEDLPPEWRAELSARAKTDPAVAKLAQGPGRLGLGRVTAAFQRALKEIGRDDVRVWMGSWNFEWMSQADPWTPAGIPFVPLDWDVVHDQSHLDTPEKRAAIRAVAARRPVIPVVWAHHDDGQYIGRSYRPYDDVWTRLAECGADSFGIIHWTTRPLDLYFKSLAEQTWTSTSNRALRATCDDMAARLFGPSARAAGGEYLFAWINDAPIFGRDTSDHFIDRPFPPERVDATVAGCGNRLAILARIDGAALAPAARERLDYYRGLERFCVDFFEAEGRHQAATALAQKGDRDGARRLLEPVRPADVMEQYARLSSVDGITRGELGMLVTMNLKWVTYIESLRQALGVAPVRMSFGATSHEEAAQGAGRLSFHVGPDSALWRVFGAKETGAAEFAIPGPAPAGAPAGWEEIAARGVTGTGALSFTVQSILSPRRGGPVPLEPGRYRLRLLFADPVATAPGQRVFDVSVRSAARAETTTTFPARKARFLRIVGHGNSENEWTSLHEVRCAALDPAGPVTASAAAKDCEPAKASDGKAETRWAADGDGAWIQFALKPDVAFGRIDIDWFEAAKRRYRFDLLTSEDGVSWTPIAVARAEESAAQTAEVDIVRDAGGPRRAFVKDFGVSLSSPGTVQVTLTPRTGAAVISGAVLEPVARSAASAVAPAGDPFDRATVVRLLERANAWQVANPRMKPDDRNWERGTWYTGVMAAHRATGAETFLKQALDWGRQHAWQVGTERQGANRLFCVETWAELYLLRRDPAMIAPAVAWLATVASNSPAGAKVWYLEGGRRYADSLYGAGTLAMMTKATGDAKYLDFLHAFFWDVHAELFDAGAGLFYRDKRFIGQTTPGGRKVFWSRGNGWVLGGIARVLEYLPAGDPQRPKYVELLRTMSAAIAKSQGADGLWRPNLDDPADAGGVPESSGTGFFCYAMAWGVRNGVLDRDTYLPVVRKAWAGLAASVSPEGRVLWGQPVGDRPVTVKAEMTHEYVTGTFLLAGSEVLRLVDAGMLK